MAIRNFRRRHVLRRIVPSSNPATPLPGVARFVGDPGVGKVWIGAQSGSGTANTGQTMPFDTFSSVILSGDATVGSASMTYPRIYGQDFSVASGYKSSMISWANAGCVTAFSVKTIPPVQNADGSPGPMPAGLFFNYDVIASGDGYAGFKAKGGVGAGTTAKASDKALFNVYSDLHAVPGPVHFAIQHEAADDQYPVDTGTVDGQSRKLYSAGNGAGDPSVTEARDFRRMMRYAMRFYADLCADLGWTPNVEHTVCYMTGDFTKSRTKGKVEWQELWPDVLDDGTTWQAPTMKLAAWDPYNPALGDILTSSSRTKDWNLWYSDWLTAWNNKAPAGRERPFMAIWEYGVYAYLDTLDDPPTGTKPWGNQTLTKLFDDMAARYESDRLVAVCFWNTNYAKVGIATGGPMGTVNGDPNGTKKAAILALSKKSSTRLFGTVNALLTESGDTITTESGDVIVLDG